MPRGAKGKRLKSFPGGKEVPIKTRKKARTTKGRQDYTKQTPSRELRATSIAEGSKTKALLLDRGAGLPLAAGGGNRRSIIKQEVLGRVQTPEKREGFVRREKIWEGGGIASDRSCGGKHQRLVGNGFKKKRKPNPNPWFHGGGQPERSQRPITKTCRTTAGARGRSKKSYERLDPPEKARAIRRIAGFEEQHGGRGLVAQDRRTPQRERRRGEGTGCAPRR